MRRGRRNGFGMIRGAGMQVMGFGWWSWARRRGRGRGKQRAPGRRRLRRNQRIATDTSRHRDKRVGGYRRRFIRSRWMTQRRRHRKAAAEVVFGSGVLLA